MNVIVHHTANIIVIIIISGRSMRCNFENILLDTHTSLVLKGQLELANLVLMSFPWCQPFPIDDGSSGPAVICTFDSLLSLYAEDYPVWEVAFH